MGGTLKDNRTELCTVQTPVYSALVYSILEVYLCLLYGADAAEFALSLLASPLMSEHCLWRTKDTTKKDCSATFTQQAAVTCQFRRASIAYDFASLIGHIALAELWVFLLASPSSHFGTAWKTFRIL